jgi:hypothetical protein
MCDADDRCRSIRSDAGTDDGDPDGDIDAEIDAMSSDLDGDGVLNEADNCPAVGNADQRDHDADAVGDACDNCPHLANPTQDAAMDNDPVGDACDPDNTRADMLVFFEGFYDAAPPGWVLPSGFTVSNGKLVGVIGNGEVAYKDEAMPPDITVITHGTMTVQTGPARSIAAVLHHTAGGDLYRCGVQDSRAELVEHNGPGFNTIDMMTLNPNLMDITIRFDITGTSLACVARSGSEVTLTGTDNTLQTGDRAGVRVRASTGTFDYVVVYSH